MRTLPDLRFSRQAPSGLALVIVLAFIVLLTILVVSFITFSGLNRTATESYSSSIAAQEIAQGGIQDILGDLHKEIQAGSTILNTNASGTAYANSYATVYLPVTNFTAVPARIGYGAGYWGLDTSSTTLPPTLIRVSRAVANSSSYASGGANFFTTTPGYYNMANVPGGAILSRASTNSAGTATPSVNGRYISTARWNTSYLLASSTSAVPAPFTSAPPDWVYVTRTGSRVCNPSTELSALLPSNNLTNTYGAVTPGINPPASPIIGRYAFVMYDEGALLDANVAGYTHNSTNIVSTADPVTGISQDTIEKSYLSYADLTQLGLSQTFIDNLVTQRNASASPATGNSYLTNVLGTYGKNGFLSFTNNSTAYDSPFVNRQDLINYFAKNDPNFNTSSALAALPHLGTFSRDANTPSYFPPSDSGTMPGYYGTGSTQTNSYYNTTGNLSGSFGYHTFMETAGYPNRDLANVRYQGAMTSIQHYDDTGTDTPSTYAVAAGDPLMQSRFSLAKINWLNQADPSTGAAPPTAYQNAIQSCFGLVWGTPGSTSWNSSMGSMDANGGNPCWNYVGSPVGAGGVSQAQTGSIETLDQVAREGREPNFFELLKAAILNGSLGKSPGTATNGNGQKYVGGGISGSGGYGAMGLFSYSYDGLWASPNNTVSAYAPAIVPDCQVIQIGANIIDQFDSGPYPSAIYFNYLASYNGGAGAKYDAAAGSMANPIYGPVDMFYGDENLPYLSKMEAFICSTNCASPTTQPTDASQTMTNLPPGGTTSISAWMQPELWNPHQQPNTPLFPSGQKFQVRAYGSVQFHWDPVNGPPPAGPPAWPAADSGGNEANSVSWLLSNSNTEGPATHTTGTVTTYSDWDGDAIISFTDNSTTSSFYRHPWLLTLDTVTNSAGVGVTVPAVGNATEDLAKSTYPSYSVQDTTTKIPMYNHFAAFWAGTSNPGGASATPPYGSWYTWTTDNNQAKGGIYHITGQSSSDPLGAGSNDLNCTTYALGWVDPSGNFHPYSYFTGVFGYEYSLMGGSWSNIDGSCDVDHGANMLWGYADPRTSRFSSVAAYFSGNYGASADMPWIRYLPSGSGPPYDPSIGMPQGTTPANMASIPASGAGFWPVIGGTVSTAYPSDWMENSVAPDAMAGVTNSAADKPNAYYSDPDGVVRPGDGYYGYSPYHSTGDGQMTTYFAGTNSTALGDKYVSGSYDGVSNHGRMPVVLNRPFRSVGELGYTYRDLPFKTLDFFSCYSADAALLDVFSITDEARVAGNRLYATVAGHVDLNNASVPVLESLLNGAAKKEDYDTNYNMKAEVPAMATNITEMISPTNNSPLGPILNRANIVTRLMDGAPATPTFTPAAPSILASFTTNADKGNKAYFEAPVRALSDVTNTRTWNLFIDVIAQSGHLAPTATSLDNFVVNGEKRYWLHIAIDRYTGKIVDQQLEPVYE